MFKVAVDGVTVTEVTLGAGGAPPQPATTRAVVKAKLKIRKTAGIRIHLPPFRLDCRMGQYKLMVISCYLHSLV
jgi:hypothetical protein